MQTMESTKRRTLTRACAAICALAIALLLSPASQSQDHRRGPEQMQQRLDERLTRLTEHLELSDQQVEDLRPIFAAQMREMRQLRQSQRGGPEGGPGEGRDAMRKLMTDTRAKIGKVLNEEQLSKFDAINQRRDRQRFGRGDRGPRPNRDGAGPPHPPRGDGNRPHGDGPPPPPRGDGFAPHGDGGPPPPGHPPRPPEPKS